MINSLTKIDNHMLTEASAWDWGTVRCHKSIVTRTLSELPNRFYAPVQRPEACFHSWSWILLCCKLAFEQQKLFYRENQQFSSADFISDLFFIISWSYWCSGGSGGSEKAPGEFQALNFGTEPFRGSCSCSQNNVVGSLWPMEVLCARAGAWAPCVFAPAAFHPFHTSPFLFLFPFVSTCCSLWHQLN